MNMWDYLEMKYHRKCIHMFTLCVCIISIIHLRITQLLALRSTADARMRTTNHVIIHDLSLPCHKAVRNEASVYWNWSADHKRKNVHNHKTVTNRATYVFAAGTQWSTSILGVHQRRMSIFAQCFEKTAAAIFRMKLWCNICRNVGQLPAYDAV